MRGQSPIRQQYAKKDQQKKQHVATTDEQDLLSYVEQQFGACESYKKGRVADSWVHLAMYMGKQWVKWNDTAGRVEEIAREDWQVHLVLNYIRPVIQQLVGKTTENRPTVIVLPATDDSDDRDKARACEKLISSHLWHRLRMQLKIQEFSRLIFQTGLGVFKVSWDPEAGDDYEMELPLSEEQQKTVEGFERYDIDPGIEPEIQSGKTGAPVVDVLSVFEVGWDPGATSMDTSRWAYHVNAMHIDDVRERWKKGKHVNPNTAFDNDMLSLRVLRSATHQRGDKNTLMSDRVKVIEYFEKPSPRYPKGLYAVVAGGVVLESQKELPLGELPFVVARHLPVHGRVDGDGAIQDLIAPQEEVNKKCSSRIENANQMLNQKWLVVKGSLVNGEITDQPGEIIEYDAQYPPPRPIAPPAMPSEVGRLQDEMLVHMRNISGVNEVQQGSVPAGISGRAIGMMADAQATVLGPTVREIEVALEDVCSRLLRYWRDNMPMPVTIRALGQEAAPEIMTFYATDIRSTDVVIRPNSLLPKQPSYRREQVMMAFTQGIFGDPSSPESQMKVRKMLEWGELDDLFGDNSRDRIYAREMLRLISGGGQVNPEPWEDHVTIIDEFHDMMTSVTYRLLAQPVQDEVKRNFAWHYYYQSQLQQGIPWWEMPQSNGWPPSQQQQQQQQPFAPEPVPPEQVFGPGEGMPPEGMPPEGVPPEQGPGMGDIQAMLQQMTGGASAPYGGPPEMNASVHGPGVPAAELGGLFGE